MAVNATTGNPNVEPVCPPTCVNVTIASGQSLSSAVDLGTNSLAGIVWPAVWDAAAVTFQVSADGVTYVNLNKSDGVTEYNIPVAESTGQPVPALSDFAGWRFLKMRSGTAASAVNQTSNRVIQLTVRAV